MHVLALSILFGACLLRRNLLGLGKGKATANLPND
jgi:hypothetical protein